MNISIYIVPIKQTGELIKQLLHQEFSISSETSELLYDRSINKHFDRLKEELYLVAETNYIDKVYRDSYYHYYSSKLSNYKRNCVRISLFAGEIKMEEFRDEAFHDKLQ